MVPNSSPIYFEFIPQETNIIIAEYIFPINCSYSPYLRLGICLRACSTSLYKIYTGIVRMEMKHANKVVNLQDRILSEETFELLFKEEYGVFASIRHINLSRASFDINLLQLLPLSVNTLHLE